MGNKQSLQKTIIPCTDSSCKGVFIVTTEKEQTNPPIEVTCTTCNRTLKTTLNNINDEDIILNTNIDLD